jgi:hypothetical protein
VERVFAGRYRPSTFLTLTLDSYGRVDAHGAAINPADYDYRWAARDCDPLPGPGGPVLAKHPPLCRWDVQYFGTVEPQKRGAPYFHAAIRGADPRAELRAITQATYHQVWWPAHDQLHRHADGPHVAVKPAAVRGVGVDECQGISAAARIGR